MKVLAIDAVSPAPSIAVIEISAGAPRLLGEARLAEAAAESIAPRLFELLAGLGLDVHDLARVAFVSGPGSFTGLRAGAAFARGLARALSRPLLSVGTFDAASRVLSSPASADLALDAGRGDVHRARRRAGVPLSEDSRPIARDEAARQAEAEGVPLLDLDRERPLLAAAAAAIAAERPETSTFAPVYGRVSAAEEKLAP